LRAGERFGNARVALPSPLAIEGTVIDELGDPVPNVTVSANMHEFIIGGYRLMAAPTTDLWRATDDRGRFRIVVTKRGSYYLSARTGTIQDTSPAGGFALTYFPGTPSLAEARPLDVDVGQEISGITIIMATARTARISGVVVGPGGPLSNTPVVLLPQGRRDVPTPFQMGVTTTNTAAGGAFTFRSVPPGAYVVQAASGTTPVAIDGSGQDDVVVRITAGGYARGRLVFEDQAAAPAPGGSVQIRPQRADLNSASTLSTATPQSVTNTDGSFVVGPGRQAFNYRAIVFSTDRNHWWVGSRFVGYALSDNAGRFRIAGLPARDYYAMALTRTPLPDYLDWDDPRYLEQASADARRLTLVEGEVRTIQLPLQYRLP
jgi:hypothetical protein